MQVDIHSHRIPENEPFTVFNLNTEKVRFFAEKFPYNNYSVGIHPWNIAAVDEKNAEELNQMSEIEQVKIIGECGLDKNAEADFAVQCQIFEYQIYISEKRNKPLLIHCVGYFNELIAMKKILKPHMQWIVHGFRGKPQLAEQLLKENIGISFGCFYNAETVEIVPLPLLYVESDESGKKTDEIYEKIAKIKKCNIHEINAGELLLKLST